MIGTTRHPRLPWLRFKKPGSHEWTEGSSLERLPASHRSHGHPLGFVGGRKVNRKKKIHQRLLPLARVSPALCYLLILTQKDLHGYPVPLRLRRTHPSTPTRRVLWFGEVTSPPLSTHFDNLFPLFHCVVFPMRCWIHDCVFKWLRLN